jgi:predicted NBD/HSP70 family sugar kinase
MKGGYKLYVSGNSKLCKYLATTYSATGARAFDADLMEQAYNEPFQTIVCKSASEMPAHNENSLDLGGNLDGNRIGFDLGGSDFKLAAIKDGEAIWTHEIPWDPYNEPNPEMHWKALNEGLEMVQEKLGGSVDAIGGSSAGVLVDNEFRIASLFRSVSKEQFDTLCRPMMQRLEEKWGVPVMCINDGEVTALAGGQSLGKNALLGIAMGTSEAVGYLDSNGKVTSWLNELAFAPVDFSTDKANMDEWSGDVGVGCMYFSQQAVNKLAGAAGYTFDADLKLPKRLIAIQDAQKAGEEGAAKIYETIGTYLGYSTASYAEFYEGLENVMILGRVTSGTGCDIILEKAREVVAKEFPELKIEFHVPDEKMKRVGQSVAAASLPESKK